MKLIVDQGVVFESTPTRSLSKKIGTLQRDVLNHEHRPAVRLTKLCTYEAIGMLMRGVNLSAWIISKISAEQTQP